jgi:hypothetical protein
VLSILIRLSVLCSSNLIPLSTIGAAHLVNVRMSFSDSEDPLDGDDRRDSFVSEDLDGPTERLETLPMQESSGDLEEGKHNS